MMVTVQINGKLDCGDCQEQFRKIPGQGLDPMGSLTKMNIVWSNGSLTAMNIVQMNGKLNTTECSDLWEA